jgi:predicted glycogen debranching enzyme
MIKFNEDICGNLEAASSREWLETNGIGGFASSTILGLNSRRYHGLLVAATKPPVGRMALLSKLEEKIIIDGRAYDLSTNKYPNAVHPQGFRYLKEFDLDPFPAFVFEVEGIEIIKTVFMVDGENTTVIQYEFNIPHSGLRTPHFELRPLIAFRDYHHLGHERSGINRDVGIENNLVSISPYVDSPSLCFAHENGSVEATGYWYRNFILDIERERGFDFTEDLFNHFVLKFDLNAKNKISIVVSTEKRDASRADELKQNEIKRRQSVIETADVKDEFLNQLVLAADQFIVSRGNEKTIIAGYHWFSDWGRDTMIALHGLTITTKRYSIAKSILLEFSKHISQGMLPNRFPDVGEEPEYNTVDATLWYFEAIRAYLKHTNDYDFVREHLFEVLDDIIAWHLCGTRYNIHVAEDGLVYAGEAGVQLTWMDAKIGDWVVTPRQGKAVEIQALWYNALCVMESLAKTFKDNARQKEYAAMAKRAKTSFNKLFWNEDKKCLYDVIDRENKDAAIRPNQIFAVSLPHSMLTKGKAKAVVNVVQKELLTPLGLRSLSPKDSQYRPRYEGDPLSRDSAYHQGTVWGWLIGPFITAYMKTVGDKEQARKWLEGFQEHLKDTGIGQFSEIFDGDPPHTPRGCVAQAWSVAELLRAAVEDVYV